MDLTFFFSHKDDLKKMMEVAGVMDIEKGAF